MDQNNIQNVLSNSEAEENIKEVLKVVSDEMENHDLLEDITPEQMATVPNELVAEKNQDVLIGSKVGEMPKVMQLKESDKNILDVIDGKIEDTDALKAKATKGAVDDFGLTDDEAEKFGEVALRYRSGEKFNYYAAMPEKIKTMIRQLAFQVSAESGGVGNHNISSMYSVIAEQMLSEFMDNNELDDIFVDFDKSIKDAVRMPTASDMYLENMKDTMVNHLEELAQTVEDEDPEKAKLLRSVKNAYIDSYSFDRMIEAYKTNGRVRKAVRRDVDKVGRYCDEYNFRNNKSTFKMSDCNVVILALRKILIEDPKTENFIYNEDIEGSNKPMDYELNDIDEIDVAKFVILMCKSSENLDPYNLTDAAYMYYSMKNIIMLMDSDQTKTPFAAELISNIINVIKLIRTTEGESENGSRDILRKPSGRGKRS